MRHLAITLCLFAALTACAGAAPMPTVTAPERQVTALPPPETKGPLSLEETLAQRRSIRSFTDTSLTHAEIGQLLWAAQGLTADWGGRTAPSAGALYPLETYVVTDKGAYHYLPAEHAMVTITDLDLRSTVWEAGLRQGSLIEAPATVVLTAIYRRTRPRYGDRAELYVHLEVGHAAQNVLLQAVSLGLGAVPIGAFHADDIAEALALPADQTVLYLIPVGHPRE